MQALQKFNGSYAGLFGTGDDEERDGEMESGDALQQFSKKFGWIYSATQIAKHQRTELEKVWSMKIIPALNTLAYLKAKVLHDKELIKQLQSRNG